MNWEIILNCSIVVAALLVAFGIIYGVINSQQLRKRKEELAKLHKNLKVGSEVMFSAGLMGKVSQLDEETAEILLSDKVSIKVSRYAITQIIQ